MLWEPFRNYLYAGLDFVINENGDPVFIEANCLPGGSSYLRGLNGSSPLETLSRNVIERFPNVCMLHDNLFDDHKKIEAFLRSQAGLGKYDFHFCPAKIQKEENYPYLIDVDGKRVKPGIILETSIYDRFLRRHEMEGTIIINSLAAKAICFDKLRCHEIVGKLNGKLGDIKQPETIEIKSLGDIKEKLDLESKWVLKPRYGREGRGIFFLEDQIPPEFFEWHKKYPDYLLQEAVTRTKTHGKHWDIRAIVAGGIFAGAYKRVSSDRVTNISRGGKREALEHEIMRKISGKCIRIVKAISEEAEKIRKGGRLDIILEETYESIKRKD